MLLADPELFLATRRSRLTPRKARLLAVALARHHWHALTDAGRAAVLVAEQHADGLVADDALFEGWMAAEGAPLTFPENAVAAETVLCATCEIADSAEYVRHYVLDLANDLNVQPALLVAWLECLLGCADIPESARTPTVASLARTIQHEQAWDRTPILADALEEAGMTDAATLEHLRRDQHVRGCHVVEALVTPAPQPVA